MSDFLNNFSGEKYQDLVDEKDEKKQQPDEITLVDYNIKAPLTQQIDVEEQPAVKVAPPKPQEKRRENFVEETEVDNNYHKKKMMRYGIIAGGVIFASVTVFLIFFLMNRVSMPDFVAKPIGDARSWALKNRIEIEGTAEFTIEFDENQVMSQSVTPTKGVQKGSVVKMTISKGANPDEVVPIPDFTKMKGPEIEAWIAKNKMTNLKVVKEFSETEENGKFLRLEFKNSNMTNQTYIRKEGATVYLSKGKEVYEKNIAVPNFSGKNKVDVETWAKDNKIKMQYEQSDSDTIALGGIISQSIAPPEKVAKETEMSVTVSLGKAVIVPSFYNIPMESASSGGGSDGKGPAAAPQGGGMTQEVTGLQVTTKQYYSSYIPYGALISQSVAAGTRLTGENKAITVVYSIGRPFMTSLVGTSESELGKIFYDYTTKNAEITYKVYYVDSEQTKGSVVSASKTNEFISMYEHVDVYVSLGNR
ncbi:MAG: PASTA domain-containing protein [Culicoidibacterales bacterium]